ncbi:IS701 family transposase [Streptomyces sp. H27-D2]|uniref:IS701 family transposase n=1 Tax=Streptomyces sp. H27-D2 TaxID=3046304 RepID=UPI002DBAEF2F|nr:DUF6296 family protein [Streptomyces sp. H27-D2]MEC4018585.1 DUF6296 family protein [Streptomyces sp. H27-D2]
MNKVTTPRAWVVAPLVIPKAGDHSVGVGRHSTSANGQHAFGVWLVADGMSCPVNWRLTLPDSWLDDRSRRRRVRIPDEIFPLSSAHLVFDAFDEMTGPWGIPASPVVMDPPEDEVWSFVESFTSRNMPFLIRIGATTALTPADQPRTGSGGAGPPAAQQVADSRKKMCRPVAWLSPVDSVARSSLVLMTTVENPLAPTASRGQPLTLLAEWGKLTRAPLGLWLSNMTDAAPAALLRLSKSPQRVAKDFSEVSSEVGIADFEGRSFDGWHRHTTLASIAHTLAIQSLTESGTRRWAGAGPPGSTGPLGIGAGPLGDREVGAHRGPGYPPGPRRIRSAKCGSAERAVRPDRLCLNKRFWAKSLTIDRRDKVTEGRIMAQADAYELVFTDTTPPDTAVEDLVVVYRTDRKGSGGHPVYVDDTGIVQAEISDRAEVRMMASGGHQEPRAGVRARTVAR